MKRFIKKLSPRFLLKAYHLFLAYFGAFIFGFPSRKMIIIGVSGTRGKTTAANLIWSGFTAAGYKTGLTGTANIRVGNEEVLNPFHMTMPGRLILQKLLWKMAREGCRVAVIETPSEGVEQFRHKGISYDAAVLTTLYPEYVEAHEWDFERCKKMNAEIFRTLHFQKRKVIGGKKVKKIIVLNNDVEDKNLFENSKVDVTATYGLKNRADFFASNVKEKNARIELLVNGEEYKLNLVGAFNAGNALAAIATLSAFGIDNESIKKGLLLGGVPGRMEKIENKKGVLIFVDYAHDAVSLEAALKTARSLAESNVIVLTGGQGGGRDKQKRPVMGEIAASLADTVVVTNEDPYTDDPTQIMEDIARGAERKQKTRGKNLFVIEDRREGIRKAISVASPGDVVLITGKGAEQSMETANGKIKWDDREVVREETQKLTPLTF